MSTPDLPVDARARDFFALVSALRDLGAHRVVWGDLAVDLVVSMPAAGPAPFPGLSADPEEPEEPDLEAAMRARLRAAEASFRSAHYGLPGGAEEDGWPA